MNETVKQALLWEAMGARNTIENCDQDIVALRRRLAHAETRRAEQVARLSDIELHLRDNGVDLAAVDAEAEKARPKHDSVLDRNFAQALASGYERSQSNINANLGRALSSIGYNDPTAGLAKALGEA